MTLPPDRATSPLDLPSRRSWLRTGATLAGAAGVAGMPVLAAAQASPVSATFDVRAFGATGVRSQNATAACQAAVDACTAAGGGTVRVPPGEYSVGTIQLKDRVTLHVEAGATLFLIQDTTQFPRGRRAMIFAENAVDIGLTGRGTLDGLAQYEFVAMRGIDPEIRDNAFEPFTSTKHTVGVGMGLTVARHSMRNLGGEVTLLPLQGGGTVATIRHPLERRNK